MRAGGQPADLVGRSVSLMRSGSGNPVVAAVPAVPAGPAVPAVPAVPAGPGVPAVPGQAPRRPGAPIVCKTISYMMYFRTILLGIV